MERKSMGGFIAVLRKANGLTQRELAEKLHVSDKTVSRWERDDGAPELSLIPVMAEIFGVTSDELLRGERKPAAEPATEQERPRAEKQRQRILAVSLSRYRNHSCIAAGLAVCGLLAALVGNLAFLRAYLGFFAGAVFLLAALVVQFVCVNLAFLSVSDTEQEPAQLGSYKRAVLLLAEGVVGLVAMLFAFLLPLVLLVSDPYRGLGGDSLLQYGLYLAVLAALLWAVAVYLLNHLLLQKGVYALGDKAAAAYRHNFRLKRSYALVLLVVLLVTAFANGIATGFGDPTSVAIGTVFTDYDSFKAHMEQDIPADYGEGSAPPAPVGPVQYYDEHGNPISEQQALTRTLTDSKGNVYCEYMERNGSVWSMRYAEREGTILPITVYSRDQILAARQKVSGIHGAFAVVYLLEIAGALFLYYRKRAK